ncbi:GntR family transcriptional regulator [Nocardioides bruguierae]|uniref:GntR family transcriptional regulator n=1 Tax=Nocardioides bruguierae TaxID=2945102 RepID=A0A9X2D9T8_9ACTN|nr:GntR family transcriptional regulator [Nocardioides bruguierae]MCL8027668.1 GntR family transcriptional regulator [Nocardioides bruguierae]MCM0621971.1 GntR family transcriptional regulator [Nocardioides bruguierae]
MPAQLSVASHREPAPSNQVRRAYEHVRSLIRSGFLINDEQLVEDHLIKTFGVSRASVRLALQQLAAEGLVVRQRRSGTRVAQDYYQVPVDDILPWQAPAGFMVRITDDRIVPSTPLIRKRLEITAESVGLVEHVFERVRPHGVEPIGVRIAYYRPGYQQPARWATCPSLADAFRSVFGVDLGHIDTVVDAVAVDADTARLLDLREGAPVLMREQVLHGTDGVPYEYTFSHYRADRVSFPVGGPHGL